MPGKVYQINVKPQTAGERGLPKVSVEQARVSRIGLEGDYCAHRFEKGNELDRAVLIMPIEMLMQLRQEGWPVEAGHLGENLTTEGIDYFSFAPEKKYRVGEAVLQISRACTPCRFLKTLPYVGEENYDRFRKALLPNGSIESNRRGWYARVVDEGLVRRGDSIEEVAA